MNQYRILNSHYPFDDVLDVVEMTNTHVALKYGKEKYRRPVVVEPMQPEPMPRDLSEG